METKMTAKPKAITKKRIMTALKQKPTSLAELNRAMGGTGSMPGSTSKKVKGLVHDIHDRLKANKGSNIKSGQAKPKSQAKKTIKTKAKTYPRHNDNPFREGSNYATCFDVLASKPKGMHVDEWKRLYSEAVGKEERLAGYDLRVLLSAKESPTSERHRSCRDGFSISREENHVQLHT
jgi:hypothetical protein